MASPPVSSNYVFHSERESVSVCVCVCVCAKQWNIGMQAVRVLEREKGDGGRGVRSIYIYVLRKFWIKAKLITVGGDVLTSVALCPLFVCAGGCIVHIWYMYDMYLLLRCASCLFVWMSVLYTCDICIISIYQIRLTSVALCPLFVFVDECTVYMWHMGDMHLSDTWVLYDETHLIWLRTHSYDLEEKYRVAKMHRMP